MGGFYLLLLPFLYLLHFLFFIEKFKEKLNDNFIYKECFLGRTHIGWELETGKAVGDDDILFIPGEVLCG